MGYAVIKPREKNKLEEEISEINKRIVLLHQEISDLNLKKKIFEARLAEMESIINPKIQINRMVSASGIIEDYYRATCNIWIDNKKERIVAYVGLCKNFTGDEKSDEVFNEAIVKIKQTIHKKHDIIIEEENQLYLDYDGNLIVK
jgi:hypothetical protein